MPRKAEIFQDPENPNKLVLISSPYTSRYLIIRDKDGNPCEPYVMEESISVNARSMDYRERMSLLRHQKSALSLAREAVRKIAQRKLL